MTSPVDLSRPVKGVAVLTINRPDKMNSIDPGTHQAMEEMFGRLESDPSVRCIVLTGAGDRAFCAGADIAQMLPKMRNDILAGAHSPRFCGITHQPVTRKPLVAAINGLAMGGGLELALACDLRVASEHARFALPEINVGILAGGGGCTRLPRTVPAALAAEMILTGEAIDAQRALQVGLVSAILPPQALLPHAIELAEKISSRSPGALRACVELLRRPRHEELQDALRHERLAFTSVMLSPDASEGIQAFIEKRPAVYAGLQDDK